MGVPAAGARLTTGRYYGGCYTKGGEVKTDMESQPETTTNDAPVADPTARVYVSHDDSSGRLDLSRAERWGRLIPIRAKLGRQANEIDLRRALEVVRETLADATDADWILPTGSPVFIGLCVHEFIRRTNSLRLLLWDRQRFDYIPNTLNVVDLPSGDDRKVWRG
jgi:hypothetical protein